MSLAQRLEICRVADRVEKLGCTGDLRVLLPNSPHWNLGVGDRASGHTAGGGGYQEGQPFTAWTACPRLTQLKTYHII